MNWYRIAQKETEFSGVIKQSDDGFTYVKVDDKIVDGLFAIMDKNDNPVKPPYFGKDGIGAHISMISSEEGEKMEEKIKEIGREVKFKLGNIVSLNPEGWDEMDHVWFVQVKCPEISKIRKRYGLPATYNGMGHKFHITFAVRRDKKASTQSKLIKTAGWGDIQSTIPKNQDIDSMLLGDVQRYVMDSYNITLTTSQTDYKYTIGLIVNHGFLGTIGYDEYWMFSKNEFKQAKKTYKEIRDRLKEIIEDFVENEKPTSMFWPYIKRMCKTIDPEHQAKSYVPNVNYSKRYVSDPDWSSNLYGNRYPKYHEDNYSETVKYPGTQTD